MTPKHLTPKFNTSAKTEVKSAFSVDSPSTKRRNNSSAV